MKLTTIFSYFAVACSPLLLNSCSSSTPESEFKDLPEICRNYDFANDPDMAETCGIRQTRYKSYKNIPPQRYLIIPKNTTIAIKDDNDVELRLPNTLPVKLDPSLKEKIDFSEDAKAVMLKNKYDYKEFFTKSGERLKLFKLTLPLANGSEEIYCFSIPKPEVDSRRKAAARQ